MSLTTPSEPIIYNNDNNFNLYTTYTLLGNNSWGGGSRFLQLATTPQ